MPSTGTTPDTVAVPAEVIVDAAATLIEMQEFAQIGAGKSETELSNRLGDQACSLLAAAVGMSDARDPQDKGEGFWGQPIVVEAYARGYERFAEAISEYAELRRDEAREIRERQNVLPEEFFGGPEATS